MLRRILDRLRGRSHGDPALIDAVQDHVRIWVGDSPTVFHERVSPKVHIDVFWVRPKEEQPYHVLVTSGMAERAMVPPAEVEEGTHCEVAMMLPAEWPLHRISESEEFYWPLHALKATARYPHVQSTWLWEGHSIQMGAIDSSGSGFAALMLTEPLLLPPQFRKLTLRDGRSVTFFAAVFLRPEELAFKLEHGSAALLERVRDQGREEELFVVSPRRASLLS